MGNAQSVNLYNPVGGVAYPSQQYFCVGENFNLKVDAVATSTGDYAVTKELPSAYPLSAGSIPINFSATGTNKFSESFPIGFTFSFYGKNYTKVAMGSNGRLVFTNDLVLDNLKDINTYTDRTFSGVPLYNTYSTLPSTDYNKIFKTPATQELNLAQIFFGYTDLISRPQNSSVTYLYKNVNITSGSTNIKGLLVSFQNQIRTNGTGGISSIAYYSNVLLLDDGKIIVYVNNKTEDTYNAILGIQNDDATKFKVPQHSNTAYNYNNGKWKSEGVAWVFTPNQTLIPKFKWFQNTTLLGETTNTLSNFSPNDGDILKVEVTYHDTSGAQVGAAVSDQVTFISLKTPQISPPNYSSGCGSPAKIDVISPDPNLIYEWFSDTDPAFHQTGTSILVGNGSYYVQVKNTNGTCPLRSTSEIVNISSSLPPFIFDNKTIYECDNLGNTSKIFDLATVTNYPLDPTKYSVQFFESGSTTAITSTTVNSGQTKNYTITVSTNAGVSPACSFTKNFSISYLSFPPDNKIYTSPKLCDEITNYSTTDFKNSFFAGSNFQFLFSTDGVNFTLNSVNPKNNNLIWVKITEPNFTCQSTVKLNFDFHPKVVANTPNPNNPDLIQCASSTQTYDLPALFNNEVNNSGTVTITYHLSLAGAQTGDNSIPNQSAFRSGLGNTIVYIRVVDNVTHCVSQDFPTVTLLVYTKPQIISANPIILKKCTGDNVFNLTQNISDITNASSPVVATMEYYSENGTLLNASQITNYDSSVLGTKPYIKVVYNSTCSDIVNFDLQFYPKPAARISQILICTESTYSLQDFQNAVISNSTQYTFTDDLGNLLPANFDVTVLPKTVKFLMKDKTTGCVSDVETVTFVKGGNSALLATETDYTLCDEDFDGITEFNLDSKKTDFTSDASATFEYFKDAAFTQSIGSSYTNETAFAQTVYAKITLPGFCPATAEIHLKVNTPTKSSTLKDKYYICYGETLYINAGDENTIFVWSDGQNGQNAIFTETGNYSVILKNGPDGCPYTRNFIISDENQPKIEVINQTNNSIEVIANGGAKPYKYYFNGVAQTSNILMNPTQASYIIQVESATGCLGEPKTVYFIKINNAFTPNADGINDVWSIENLDKMENISIVIADRYGTKVFESTNPAKTVWDGKSNGRELPTSSYWYVISWYDSVTQKTEQRQGWILLKNRN